MLGGGGSTGNAWLIGAIAGLAEAGLDVTDADLVIGTSAGSTAAAQITSALSPSELYAGTVAPVPQQHRQQRQRQQQTGAVVNHMERTGAIIAASTDADDMRRRLCAAALELDAVADSARHAQWRATVAARLPSPDWPEQTIQITAVDVRTAEPVVFDRHSGVDLADAIAASCANGAPHGIGDGRYIDGGYRRNENADLAAGYEQVLVLAPFGGRTRTPTAWGLDLATQLDELRAGGSRVETVFPDRGSDHMFGVNAMDLSLRAPAARSGHTQGLALAEQLTAFWR